MMYLSFKSSFWFTGTKTSSNHQLVDLPLFLISSGLIYIVPKDAAYNNKSVFLFRSLWAKFFLMSKLDLPSKLYLVVDGVQFKSDSSSWGLQFNTTHAISDSRVSISTYVPITDYSLPSISQIYMSTVWLERELSDFSGINFLGLVDTRRLLLDYFEPKMSWQSHIGNDKNFNEFIYDINMSY